MSGRTNDGVREAVVERLRKYLVRPRTMEQLTTRFDVEPRSIFRYFSTLYDEGYIVSRVGVGRPTRYKI
jgi:transcriptional regulator GlxA family with amidase domain